MGMKCADDFSTYITELLEGRYDCVDRIILNGYFPMGQASGGLITWWSALHPKEPVDQKKLLQMAGDFSRRVHAFAKQHQIPLIHCATGDKKKHALAEEHQPKDPNFHGLFLILVAKAPGLVWQADPLPNGRVRLRRKRPWPLINHYHFHLVDKEWGHINIKMSGHPPFGVQVMLNGHEWVERAARQQSISWVKEGNCFVGGSDFKALDGLADQLCGQRAIGRLAQVCERWVYSSCLCFGLSLEEQRRSGFQYQYSCFQLEYSRNLLFQSGQELDQVYQGLIDRTRRLLDVPKLRTIFGRKHRPHRDRAGGSRLERVIDDSVHDLTVFKLHFGKLTLKMYDKGDRVLRIEVIANNVAELRCGKRLEKLSLMLAKLQRMLIEFLGVVQAAHLSFLDSHALDQLPAPTVRGMQRLAGVDLQRPRMRAVAEAVMTLAAAPNGFTARQLVEPVRKQGGRALRSYTARQAAYDLRKLRGKNLVEPIKRTRRYRVRRPGIRTLAALLILREKVIKPVLAGAGRPQRGRPPKNVHPLDVHYQTLQRDMVQALRFLKLAA